MLVVKAMIMAPAMAALMTVLEVVMVGLCCCSELLFMGLLLPILRLWGDERSGARDKLV